MSVMKMKKIGNFLIHNQQNISLNLHSPHSFNYCTEINSSENLLIEIIKKPNGDYIKQSEFWVLKQITHPNIVKVHDLRVSENNVYIVYENFATEYETLADFLKKTPNLSAKEAIEITLQIIEGVKELNKNGLIHRSISSNTIIKHNSKWKVAGYETIKYLEDPSKCKPSKMTKSFRNDETDQIYLDPELLEKCYGFGCDVYNIGVLLMEMLVGKEKMQKNKGKYIFKDLTINHPDIVDILKPLLNENQTNTIDIRKMKKSLEKYKIKLEEAHKLILKKNISRSMQLPSYESHTTNKTTIKKNYEDNLKISEENLNVLKKSNNTNLKSPKHKEFISFLKVFADSFRRKVTEISKISNDFSFKNRNAMIYELVYLLLRLECILRKKIMFLSLKSKNSENYKADYDITKEKIKKINELIQGKRGFFKKIVQDLTENEDDELNESELGQIMENFKEFIATAFDRKESKNINKNVLMFLEDLAWISNRRRINEDIFGKNENFVNIEKYENQKNKLKEREKKEKEFVRSELIDKIIKYLKK